MAPTDLQSSILPIVAIAGSVAVFGLWKRRLPLQNVIGAAAVLLLIGFAAQSIAANFSRLSAETAISALLWIPAGLGARGLARLVLRRYRRSNAFGIAVLALSSALCAAAVFLLNQWFTSPALHPLFVLIAAIIAQVVITPWLLDKRLREPAEKTLQNGQQPTGGMLDRRSSSTGC